MAYSGTQTFNLQIEEIIEEALERCQLEARSGYDLKTAKRQSCRNQNSKSIRRIRWNNSFW